MTDNKYTSYSQINIGDTVLFMGKKVLVSDLDLDNSYAALAWWDNDGELVMHPIIEEQIRLLERVEPEAKESPETDLGAGEDMTSISITMWLSELRKVRDALQAGKFHALAHFTDETDRLKVSDNIDRALRILPDPFTEEQPQ